MSEHKASITWSREGHDFSYQNYPRNHQWSFGNGLSIEASAASAFYGDKTKVDPEQTYVASLSSCHMLTFLALCSKKRILVERYVDHAVGFLEKNSDGKLVISRIELHPEIEFGTGIHLSTNELEKLHALAHHECFIANSVKTEIKTIID